MKTHNSFSGTQGHTHPPILQLTYLLDFGALIPAAHLAATRQVVHGHQADGESQGAHYHLPWVRSYQQAVEPEQTCQHAVRRRMLFLLPYEGDCLTCSREEREDQPIVFPPVKEVTHTQLTDKSASYRQKS